MFFGQYCTNYNIPRAAILSTKSQKQTRYKEHADKVYSQLKPTRVVDS